MRIKTGLSEIQPYQPGKVVLILDTLDDIWHFYNVVSKGDLLQIKVTRKIAHETSGGNKGSTTKKTLNITIKCETIEYDSNGDEIRINGKNVSQNEFISVGQFQSASIVRGIQFGIIKRSWDPFVLETMQVASDPTLTSDLAVLLMEEGISHLYLVSSHLTLLKGKVELSIPKKRKGPSNHDKSIIKFFTNTLDNIVKHVNFDIVKCLVVGSPGFVKDQFGMFMNEKVQLNDKMYDGVKKNLSKFIYTHTNSGYKQALTELLGKNEVLLQIKNTKASEEILLMNRFNEILGKDYEKVIFGIKHIEIAIEQRAIDFILVSDDYLRRIGPHNRKSLQLKFDKAEIDGGVVKKMSSMLPTGERVNNLGGMTAVLKFLIPELDDVEEDNFDVKDQEEDSEDGISELQELIGDAKLHNDEDKDEDHEAEDGLKAKPSKTQQKERCLDLKAKQRKKSQLDSDDE